MNERSEYIRSSTDHGAYSMQAQTSPGGWGALVSFVVVAGLLLFRFRNLATPRKQSLGPGWLLVSPFLVLALSVVNFAQRPPQGIEWLWLVAALGTGAILGWWRGKLMTITVHPVTLEASSQASPLAVIFLFLIVGVRYGLRSLMFNEASAWHLRLPLIVGCALVFGLGMLTAQRVEMTLRANLLVVARQAGRTSEPAIQGSGESIATPVATPETRKLLMLAAAVFLAILVIGLALPR